MTVTVKPRIRAAVRERRPNASSSDSESGEVLDSESESESVEGEESRSGGAQERGEARRRLRGFAGEDDRRVVSSGDVGGRKEAGALGVLSGSAADGNVS